VLDSPPGALSAEVIARARLLRAIVLAELGMVAEAEAELDAILKLSGDLADRGIPAEAHRVLANLHTWTGHPDRVRTHAKLAAKLARDSGARSVEFWGIWAEATLEGLLGNTTEMAGLIQAADAIAQTIRSPVLGLRTMELAIELAAARGEWEKGLALGEQAIALARTFSQRTVLPRVLVWTSLLYLGRGDVELARPLLEEAWKSSGAGGEGVFNLHGAIPAHIGMGFLALTQGDIPEAIRVGRAGLAMADKVGYGIWSLHRLIPLLAEAYLRAGDLVRARKMGERLREGSAPVGSRLGLARAQAVDALCTLLSGDLEAGIGEVEAAARELEGIPMVGEAVMLRRLKAESLAKLGDRKAALEELTRVHQTLLMLGAIRELEKARELFRELDARPPRKAVGGEGDLSTREVEISRLVESRKSNKAIARELGISPRTVSTHLSNIYQKLGIGSRGELADYVRSQVLLDG
jgi:ATP/maltotriose-dependent transcriptional regulator MalT